MSTSVYGIAAGYGWFREDLKLVIYVGHLQGLGCSTTAPLYVAVFVTKKWECSLRPVNLTEFLCSQCVGGIS